MAQSIVLCVGLLALVGLAFARVLSFGFTGLDDPVYVASNPHVLGGLTPDNLRHVRR